jgi:hypothetical protein
MSEATSESWQQSWAVFKVAKSGGIVRVLSVHQSKDAATQEARRLASEDDMTRFSVMQVVVSDILSRSTQ